MQITGSYNNIFEKYFETSKCARTTLSTSIFENFYAHAGHTVLNTSASAVSLTYYDGVLKQVLQECFKRSVLIS